MICSRQEPAVLLEEVIACGVLAKKLVARHLVVVSAALRDDGASYHYLPPGREVAADPRV